MLIYSFLTMLRCGLKTLIWVKDWFGPQLYEENVLDGHFLFLQSNLIC
jgi:hypothetical protein